MPVDIFPSINIPIIMAGQYQGLPPDEMAGRIITPFERALTTTVNDIAHIESNSYTTFGIVKIYFHPGVNIATANAQVTAISQTLLKQMPPGATPPLDHQLQRFDRADHPCLPGKGLTEQSLADLGLNFVRTRLVTGRARHSLSVRWKDTAGDVRPQHRRVAAVPRALTVSMSLMRWPRKTFTPWSARSKDRQIRGHSQR